MNRHWMRWIGIAGWLLLAGNAIAGNGTQLTSRECGYSTPYDVQVGADGVWLRRDDGVPRVVHVHAGAISIDHSDQRVSPADADRLRRMEALTRALVPAVAGIARDAVEIAFDALAHTVEVMTGSAGKARRIEDYRRQALSRIDGSLGKGRWDQAAFERDFEQGVERAAEDMAASLASGVMFAVFTGDAERIEQRSQRLEKTLDARMDARSRALEARAQALCEQVRDLDALQRQLELRYRGQPLRLLERHPPHDLDEEPPRQDDQTLARAGR